MAKNVPAQEAVVTAAQVRAARALLNWSRDQLAAATGVPMRTLARLEVEEGVPQRRTVEAVVKALTDAGIEFDREGDGVRRKTVRADAS